MRYWFEVDLVSNAIPQGRVALYSTQDEARARFESELRYLKRSGDAFEISLVKRGSRNFREIVLSESAGTGHDLDMF